MEMDGAQRQAAGGSKGSIIYDVFLTDPVLDFTSRTVSFPFVASFRPCPVKKKPGLTMSPNCAGVCACTGQVGFPGLAVLLLIHFTERR